MTKSCNTRRGHHTPSRGHTLAESTAGKCKRTKVTSLHARELDDPAVLVCVDVSEGCRFVSVVGSHHCALLDTSNASKPAQTQNKCEVGPHSHPHTHTCTHERAHEAAVGGSARTSAGLPRVRPVAAPHGILHGEGILQAGVTHRLAVRGWAHLPRPHPHTGALRCHCRQNTPPRSFPRCDTLARQAGPANTHAQ